MSLACEKPARHGRFRGKPLTGTRGGYQRHYQAGEPPCSDCKDFYFSSIGRTRPDSKPCEVCGGTFNPPRSDSRHCSLACSEAGRRQGPLHLVCDWCGTGFVAERNRRSCSALCRTALKTYEQRTTPWASPFALDDGGVADIVARFSRTLCGWCRKDVPNHGLRRFCSTRCRTQHRQHQQMLDGGSCQIFPRACGECQQWYVARRPNGRYCSQSCRKKSRTGVSVTVRNRVLRRDGLRCGVCSEMTDPSDFKIEDGVDGRSVFVVGDLYPSIDHIVPRSLGGSNHITNLRVAHFLCNSLRGTAEGEQLAWAV